MPNKPGQDNSGFGKPGPSFYYVVVHPIAILKPESIAIGDIRISDSKVDKGGYAEKGDRCNNSELSEGTGVKASKQQLHSALVNAAIAEDLKAVRMLAEVIKNGEYQLPKYSVKTNYSLLTLYAVIPVILMWLLTLSCLWVRQGFELEKNNA